MYYIYLNASLTTYSINSDLGTRDRADIIMAIIILPLFSIQYTVAAD
jgi:hypothetical protein